MFCKGDKIVYGSTGVCVIEDICEKELVRNKKQQYYILKPIFQPNNTIYAPVNDGKVSMRPLISAKEANDLIGEIPKIIDGIGERSLSNEDYRNAFLTQNCTDLVRLARVEPVTVSLTAFYCLACVYFCKATALLQISRFAFQKRRLRETLRPAK